MEAPSKIILLFTTVIEYLSICHSLITKTSMICSSFVTLSLPLLCVKVQMYFPLSCGCTGLMYKLPLESFMNLPLSSGISSCLFHSICGAGVPSALQLIIPELSATILWLGLVESVNLAFGSNIHKINCNNGL